MSVSKVTLAETIRNKGLKATKPRIEVLSLIAKSTRPVGVPDLLENGTAKDLDTVTLYRSLETLADVRLIRKVDLRHGHTDYEFVADSTHHHHLICESCGRIEDISWCPDESFERKLIKNSKHFSRLSDHALEFFGVCTSCNRARS